MQLVGLAAGYVLTVINRDCNIAKTPYESKDVVCIMSGRRYCLCLMNDFKKVIVSLSMNTHYMC